MRGKPNVKKTNAMRLLDAAGISYDVLTYECDGVHLEGELVAAQLGLPEGQVFKTLVLRDEKRQPIVCCLPVSATLDTKALAAAWDSKSVEMIPMKDLQSLTGYIRGACSPVGMKKALPTFVDESALNWDRIGVSAGQRGLQLFLAPGDLIRYVGGITNCFAREKRG